MTEIDDFLSNGMIRRWELIDGHARCPLDAIPATDSDALAVLQRNAAVRTMIGAVETYEAAQRIVAAGEPDNGRPRQMADPDAVRPEDAADDWSAPLIDNPDWVLAPRTVETTDSDGQPQTAPEPRWQAYDAAVAIVAGASEPTLAHARWRAGEPVSGDDGHSLANDDDEAAGAAWESDRAATLAELDRLAAIPLAVDPRFPVFDPSLVKAECGRRIYAVASDNAQKNMLAAICAGLMADADKTIFETGVVWIAQMQAASRDLIAARHMTFADNEHWPPVPPGVRDLALRY